MIPELEDDIDFLPGFLFNFLEGVNIPGIQHERLFTDGMGFIPQCQPDVGIVQVIWRTDGYVIHFIVAFTAKFIQVPVETFRFHEKVGIREIRIDNTDAIERIHSCNQVVPGIFDGLHMSWGDEACCTN
jgi:hypothetical protein